MPVTSVTCFLFQFHWQLRFNNQLSHRRSFQSGLYRLCQPRHGSRLHFTFRWYPGIPENGRQIDGLDDKFGLAHRMILVNLLWVLRAVKNKKASRHFLSHHLKLILQLVCSQGVFHMSPDGHGLQFDNSASSASGGSVFDLNIWHSAFRDINKFLGNRMYFL